MGIAGDVATGVIRYQIGKRIFRAPESLLKNRKPILNEKTMIKKAVTHFNKQRRFTVGQLKSLARIGGFTNRPRLPEGFTREQMIAQVRGSILNKPGIHGIYFARRQGMNGRP
ncbi:Uncharacterised protein [uncultured archaeon]|nr:Uncharacterised protein [uncultured archaeon]